MEKSLESSGTLGIAKPVLTIVSLKGKNNRNIIGLFIMLFQVVCLNLSQ